jgi:hypothetical protein
VLWWRQPLEEGGQLICRYGVLDRGKLDLYSSEEVGSLPLSPSQSLSLPPRSVGFPGEPEPSEPQALQALAIQTRHRVQVTLLSFPLSESHPSLWQILSQSNDLWDDDTPLSGLGAGRDRLHGAGDLRVRSQGGRQEISLRSSPESLLGTLSPPLC